MGLARSSWAVSMFTVALSILRKHEVHYMSVSYPYPDGAMNIATKAFMDSECDEMVLIDEDIRFQPTQLEQLLGHDLPLVFGLYPQKKPGLTFPAMGLDFDFTPFANDGRPPLRELAACARGFMKAKREVFEGTEIEPGVWWKTDGIGHNEDFDFCKRYRDKGGKVMVDISICCNHEGSAVYPIPGTFTP